MLPGLPVASWRSEVEVACSLESLKAEGHAVAYGLIVVWRVTAVTAEGKEVEMAFVLESSQTRRLASS